MNLSGGISGSGLGAAGTRQLLEQAYRLFQQGQLDAAGQAAGQLVAAEPNNGRGVHLLGLIALSRGALAEAVKLISRSIELMPNEAGYYANLGEAHRAGGDAGKAEEAYRRALAINPRAHEALGNLALLQLQTGKFLEAEKTARAAVAAKEDFAAGHNTLGTILGRLGRLAEATGSFKRSAELMPTYHVAQSNYLLALNYDPEVSAVEVAGAHRKWGEMVEAGMAGGGHVPALVVRGRVRLGILSPDMRKHSVAYLLEPLLEGIDHNRFHVTCYNDCRATDEVSRRLRRAADSWRDVANLDDGQLCKLIGQDEIDVLVDVAGHTANNRMPVYARHPAPRAVTLFGYPNTTGLKAVNWRITDEVADPEGVDGLYVEKLLRMKRLCWVFKPSEEAPEVGELPAVRNGYVTFGSFNNVHKISKQCAAAWAQLVARVAGSRFLLLAAAGEDNAYARGLISEAFAGAGVSAERLRIEGKRPRAEYLKLIGEVDVAVDAFPYNGGITTAETLWQGVPVLSVAGERYASRQGLAILTAIGRAGWCAATAEDLAEVGARVVGDLGLLAKERAGLREVVRGSALVDFVGYGREFGRVLLEELGSRNGERATED